MHKLAYPEQTHAPPIPGITADIPALTLDTDCRPGESACTYYASCVCSVFSDSVLHCWKMLEVATSSPYDEAMHLPLHAPAGIDNDDDRGGRDCNANANNSTPSKKKREN